MSSEDKKINEMLKQIGIDKKETMEDCKKSSLCDCEIRYHRGYFQGYEDALRTLKTKK